MIERRYIMRFLEWSDLQDTYSEVSKWFEGLQEEHIKSKTSRNQAKTKHYLHIEYVKWLGW